MKAISGCRVVRGVAVLALAGAVLLSLSARAGAGDKAEWAKKVNVHYCKCGDSEFATPEGKDVHCPCGMHKGKWCNCGHPHRGLYHVGVEADGALKKGDKRVLTVALLQWGAGEEAGKGDGKAVENAQIEVTFSGRGEVWVCPMKCAESETTEKCPVCHMKMKKGEGWKAAGAAVAAAAVEGKPGHYTVEVTPDLSGKARLSVSAKAGETPVLAEFEVEIAE